MEVAHFSDVSVLKQTKKTEDDGKDVSNSYHPLSRQWTLWTHLPHDTDWTINSYKKFMVDKCRGDDCVDRNSS